MNKRTNKLIFAISVLVLLCAIYIFVVPKDNGSDEEENSTDREAQGSTRLGGFDVNSITAISFNGISLTFTDGKWLYTDDSDYPVDNDKASSLANTLANLSYSDCIKKSEAEDLSVYGFNEATEVKENGTSPGNISYNNLTLEISFTADGAAHTYYVGGYNSIIGGYYMTFDNDDYIYMVNSDITNAFDYENIYDLLVIDTIPEIDSAYITGMAVVTPKTSYTFTPEMVTEEGTASTDVTSDNASDGTSDDGSTGTSSIVWYMQSTDIAAESAGAKTAVDTDTFSTVVNNILTASTGRSIAYKPSDDELSAYGLSIPAYTVVITYTDDSSDTEEKTLTLYMGASDDDGNTYAVINDSDMVVTISSIDLEVLFQQKSV